MNGLTTSAVDKVFLYITGISVLLLMLITFLMVFFALRYRKEKHKQAQNIEGNTLLEIVWTVIPTLIVISMFFFGLKGFDILRSVPEEHLEVKVRARMWSWLFEYANGIKSDKLYVPAGKAVKLVLTSEDVIHSLFIPAFRVKEDAVPRMNTYLWFKADSPGEYDIFCAEYCGRGHSSMLTKLKVLEDEDFDKWYESGGITVAEGRGAGEVLIREKGCTGCHTTDGSTLVGPTFKGIYMRKTKVFREGKIIEVISDDNYLRDAILEPSKDTVKDYPQLMPSFKDQLTQEELEEILEYLKTLK